MKRWMLVALLTGATLAHAQTPTKKELVQKLMQLQQPAVESVARGLVEQPAAQLMQAAGRALQSQVPAEKREIVGKGIETDVKKFVDESYPLVRERGIKLAPTTLGAAMEEKFSEDELKQLITWFESPVNKKYQQLGPEMQNDFVQKLVAESRPVVEPKLQALEEKVRAALGPTPGAAASATAAPARTAASAARSAPKAASK